MSIYRHHVDELDGFIVRHRVADGMDEDEASDFTKHPATDDEILAAELWLTERLLGDD